MNAAITGNGVLHFDIFRPLSRGSFEVLPERVDRIVRRLQQSISRIQEDVLRKLSVSNERTAEILFDLETSLTAILESSLGDLRARTDEPNILRLNRLHQFAARYAPRLRRHVVALQEAGLFQRGLFKDHTTVQNLEMRLTHTRCKIVSEILQSGSRKGKVRHLRCTNTIRLPRRIKMLVRKCAKDILNVVSDSRGEVIPDLQKLFGQKLYWTEESVERAIEVAFTGQYGSCGQSEIDIAGAADNNEMNGWNNEQVNNGVLLRSPRKPKRSTTDEQRNETFVDEVEQILMTTDFSEGMIRDEDLNLDNFRLVDVWEEKEDTVDDHVMPPALKTISPSMELLSTVEDSSRSGRKRRSRFAPLCEQDLSSRFGFSNTFIDEDTSRHGDSHVVLPIVLSTMDLDAPFDDEEDGPIMSMTEERVADQEKMPLLKSPSSLTDSVHHHHHEHHLPTENRAELCRDMLRRFHDTLIQSFEAYERHDQWNAVKKSVEGAWRSSSSSVGRYRSEAIQAAAQEAYRTIEIKMDVLARDFISRLPRRRVVTHNRTALTAVSGSNNNRDEHSPSPPTPFEQTIEASLTRISGQSITHPVVGRRSLRGSSSHQQGQQTGGSDEMCRVRAMLQSYKRDVEKNKEVAAQQQQTIIVVGGSTASNSLSIGGKDDNDNSGNDEIGNVGIISGDDVGDSNAVVLPLLAGPFGDERRESELDDDDDDDGSVSSSSSISSMEGDVDEPEKGHDKSDRRLRKNQDVNRMQWLVPSSEAPSSSNNNGCIKNANPTQSSAALIADNLCDWSSRKVFLLDSVDPPGNSATSQQVRAILQRNGAVLYDSSNYKQAGRDLHVLLHAEWRVPDQRHHHHHSQSNNPTNNNPPPVSMLFLKNNSSVHFLSYYVSGNATDNLSLASCQPLFPHSRSCIFLDDRALAVTHPDNIRNMLDFMIGERQKNGRIWCLKIMSCVYRDLKERIMATSSANDNDTGERLRTIDGILSEYGGQRYSEQQESSLALLEVQPGEGDDLADLQQLVLDQQYFLQRKFRHFCILTDSLNTTELDIRHLSNYGVAVLPLSTFLVNKIGKYVS